MATDLSAMAASLGALLKERKETVAVSESSAGGLISAALLAVPGASKEASGSGRRRPRSTSMPLTPCPLIRDSQPIPSSLAALPPRILACSTLLRPFNPVTTCTGRS